MRIRLIILLVFALFWVLAQGVWAQEASTAVTHLQDTLLKIMKDGEKLGYRGRYDMIRPVVTETHDLSAIARIAMGQYWKELNEEQQNNFTNIFGELSHSTYAGRFDSFSGEKFSVISEESLKKNRKLVQTRFLKADGEEIRFNYILHQVNDQWKIINIMVNGVSDLALKRTEYSGILKKDGYSTLIEKLRTQIKENADGL